MRKQTMRRSVLIQRKLGCGCYACVSLLLLLGWASARGDEGPRLEPLPASIPGLEDSAGSRARIELGRRLFFDVRLSGDNTMSCATCHPPDKAFADGRPRGVGHEGKELARNVPTLLNIAWMSPLFWDGRAPSLEAQALMPIEAADEMRQPIDALVQELQAIDAYAREFQAVYGGEVQAERIAVALAAFERSLVTRASPWDRFVQGERGALSAAAQRGLELFTGEAGCVRCHHGPLLSDGKFYRLGVSLEDAGLAGVTGKDEDRGKFRTPSLRNVAQTGPYMHDGSLATLTEVVQFYYRTAPSEGPDGAALDIQPLTDRSFAEIADLVAFLEALSGAYEEPTQED